MFAWEQWVTGVCWSWDGYEMVEEVITVTYRDVKLNYDTSYYF